MREREGQPLVKVALSLIPCLACSSRCEGLWGGGPPCIGTHGSPMRKRLYCEKEVRMEQVPTNAEGTECGILDERR